MLIKYQRNNVHAFGDKEGKTIYSLRPGWNEFPKAIWDQYKDHPEVKRMLETGAHDKDSKEVEGKPAIELMNETVKVGKKTVKLGQDDTELQLKLLEEKKAIAVVKATFNRQMLQRWLDEENRHKVKRALEEQITPLLPEKKAG